MKPGNRPQRHGANSCRLSWQMRGRAGIKYKKTPLSCKEGFFILNANLWLRISSGEILYF